jgi:FAD/FMN-containing dehydrogenase
MEILRPGEPGYDTARRVWNGMIDRCPRLIARCASTADVVAAVRMAPDQGLEIGVRCGGHSIAGHAVPDDGLMIDLTPMGAVDVDPSTRRATVQGGAMLGALDRAAQQHGLATTAGNVSHTGVGGLTLGGGMGWLARQFGLSCDNVEAYEVVTAAGDVVRATAHENPDLFFALRGGGGNFGIVTSFEFRLYPIGSQALLVELTHPLDRGAAVLRGWRDLSETVPRAATFTASITRDEVTVGFVWIGDPAEGQKLVPDLLALGRPDTERVQLMSYLELQTMDDNVQGHLYRRYWKGHYFRELSDAAIDALVGPRGEYHPNVSLQAYGGAIADVPDDAAAFSQRGTRFEYVSAMRWDDPAEDAPRMAASRAAAAQLEPFATGAYVNVLNDEGGDGVRRAYPTDKLAKLTRIKDTYDPDNVFHLNQNIPPSV